MLPGPSPNRFGSRSYFPEYFKRLLHYPQMDIEYTFWQMFYLCVNPSRVYRTTSWRKLTKNQWARDDPAFVVILVLFIAVAALAYTIAFRAWFTPLTILRFMFWAAIIEFLSAGLAIATICWFIANKYLQMQLFHAVDQKVEWLYAFDIHCNSFFPLFVVLYVLQFFLLPLLLSEGFFATVIANTMYALALAYYFYVTFLGYNILPFLHNTVLFLYPIGGVGLLYALSIIFRFNCSIFVINYYFYSTTP